MEIQFNLTDLRYGKRFTVLKFQTILMRKGTPKVSGRIGLTVVTNVHKLVSTRARFAILKEDVS